MNGQKAPSNRWLPTINFAFDSGTALRFQTECSHHSGLRSPAVLYFLTCHSATMLEDLIQLAPWSRFSIVTWQWMCFATVSVCRSRHRECACILTAVVRAVAPEKRPKPQSRLYGPH